MKVIDVSEVLNAIDLSSDKKEKEKDQILDIRNSVHGVIQLDDALKGDMGESVKEHFISFHIPIIVLLNQFLGDYNKSLSKLKNVVLDYETDSGLVRQPFVENDMEEGIERIRLLSENSIDDINQQLHAISDLVNVTPLIREPLMYQYDTAQAHNKKTVKDLLEMDEEGTSILKEVEEDLAEIVHLVQKLKQWAVPDNLLNKETIKDIEAYFSNNKKLNKMVEDALETAIKDADEVTLLGHIANVLGGVSDLTGIKALMENGLGTIALFSKRIIFVKDGKGNFRIQAHPDWKQKNGTYNSKLASIIHEILKKGSNSSVNFIKETFEKFQNAPSNVLRLLGGLQPGTTRLGYEKILNDNFRFLKFNETAVKSYGRNFIDLKETVSQFSTKEGIKGLVTKIPIAGMFFSISTNSSEFFSDENKYKSIDEKAGRAIGGIGMDISVAALTSGAAALGTLACPGPGTIIGGAIGAVAGVTASLLVGDKAKDIGEKAVKGAIDKYNKFTEFTQKLFR